MKEKIKVLIVDDSFLMRRLLRDILEEDPDIEVVGTARDGKEALKLLRNLEVDVITLDYEMPDMNGIEVLEKIMKYNPVPCIMVSAYTKEGAKITLEALSRGAFDFVPKPSGELSLDIIKIRDELIDKIKSAKKVKMERIKFEYEEIETLPCRGSLNISCVGIASSTGGTVLIEYIIKNLPSNLGIPFFIVQHMPPLFTLKFAERLNEITGKKVKETEDKEEVKKDIFYIAKGGVHVILEKKGKNVYISHKDFPARNGVKPSADYLFESMAEIYGEKACAIILTGMGRDGVDGAKKIKEKGGYVWVQNKETCLVFGMPRNAIKEKIVDKILSPEEIVKNLTKI
ncbi:MAG: chemotaxis response regulator protein-glutamate methylesterase [candidate division WOR-3 bacterium]